MILEQRNGFNQFKK